MKREHGCRFSHVSHNAATSLMFFDELILFADQNGNSKKLHEMRQEIRKNKDLIRNELQSIAACWFLILSPLWDTLKKSNANVSLKLIDEFTTFSTAIQAESSLAAASKVTDGLFNNFMYPKDVYHEFAATSLEGKLIDMVKRNEESMDLNLSIKKMLKAASGYMLKLSNNWTRDHIPDASVKVPFSNQVYFLLFTVNFFNYADHFLKIITKVLYKDAL